MRKALKTISLVFVFLFCLASNIVNAEAISTPEINAEGSILIDSSTGEVLYEKNGEETFEPASTTKVMTALVVLDKAKLDDEVTVHEDFTKIDGTAIGLLNGDVLTVKELLLGLLLESGNDCANALAEHISGNIDDFAKLMNSKAKELGALHTNFKNPSGLPDPEHITTPHDLALFMREAINNKDFIEISTTNSYTITMKNNSSRTILLNNKNYMINKNSKYYYEYATCGKNGYTTKANHTYVAAAKKDNQTLIATFLNAQDKNQNFNDMKSVFNYGFDNFTSVPLYKKGEEVSEYKIDNTTTVPLITLKDVNYIVPKGEENKFTPKLTVEDKDLKKVSFNKGEKILDGKITLNDKNYITIDLASGVSREYKSPIKALTTSPKTFTTSIAVISAVALGAAFIVFRSILKKKSRLKRFKHLKKNLNKKYSDD